MARSLRIEYPGAVYHVTSRGNGGQAVFLDDGDRAAFLQCLGLSIERHGWRCHGYCLMDDHYHLLLETPRANLSLGMRQVNGVYTQAFNRAHERGGHLFQGRYKAILVERDAYLLELARYVVLNPVRAGLVARAGDWPWSSYRATAGEGAGPPWLVVDWLRRQFGGPEAWAPYRQYVAEGMADKQSPLAGGLAQAVTGGAILGGADFVAGLAPLLRTAGREVPMAQRNLARPSLADLRATAADTKDRAWMVQAQRTHGYRQSQIAAEAGLHYSTVSRLIKALEANKSK